jgi:thiol:disulfide interchange protein
MPRSHFALGGDRSADDSIQDGPRTVSPPGETVFIKEVAVKQFPRPVVIAAVVLALLAGARPAPAQGTKSDSKVKFTTTADKPGADGKQVVTITMAIEKDWHAYANPVGNDDYVPSQTKVTVEGKTKPEELQVEYPKGKLIVDKMLGDFYVYEGTVVIKATVARAKDETGPLKFKVKFMTCNDKGMCLLPATVELSVP